MPNSWSHSSGNGSESNTNESEPSSRPSKIKKPSRSKTVDNSRKQGNSVNSKPMRVQKESSTPLSTSQPSEQQQQTSKPSSPRLSNSVYNSNTTSSSSGSSSSLRPGAISFASAVIASASKDTLQPLAEATNQNSTAASRPLHDQKATTEARTSLLFSQALWSMVTVTLQNGNVYKGYLSSINPDDGYTSLTLFHAYQVNSSVQSAIIEHLAIPADQFLSMSIDSLDLLAQPSSASAKKGLRNDIKTDAEIGASKNADAAKDRELQRWQPSKNDLDSMSNNVQMLSLEEQESSAQTSWDQFRTNEKLFGVKSNYEEELYTTKIDKSHPEYKAKEAKAERIAKEIEAEAAKNPKYFRDEEENETGLTEEEMFSSVKRTVNPNNQSSTLASSNSNLHISHSQVDNRLQDLKHFSKSFQIKAPIPDDLIPILAKDKEKQREIIEKNKNAAQRNQVELDAQKEQFGSASTSTVQSSALSPSKLNTKAASFRPTAMQPPHYDKNARPGYTKSPRISQGQNMYSRYSPRIGRRSNSITPFIFLRNAKDRDAKCDIFSNYSPYKRYRELNPDSDKLIEKPFTVPPLWPWEGNSEYCELYLTNASDTNPQDSSANPSQMGRPPAGMMNSYVMPTGYPMQSSSMVGYPPRQQGIADPSVLQQYQQQPTNGYPYPYTYGIPYSAPQVRPEAFDPKQQNMQHPSTPLNIPQAYPYYYPVASQMYLPQPSGYMPYMVYPGQTPQYRSPIGSYITTKAQPNYPMYMLGGPQQPGVYYNPEMAAYIPNNNIPGSQYDHPTHPNHYNTGARPGNHPNHRKRSPVASHRYPGSLETTKQNDQSEDLAFGKSSEAGDRPHEQEDVLN